MSHPDSSSSTQVLSSRQLLHHWQGHRRLTRRVIETFPEEELFRFRIGEMRPFGVMALELVSMAQPMVKGAATGEWDSMIDRGEKSKQEILRLWDQATEGINKFWKQLSSEDFQERITAFGQYEGPMYELMLYVIDNEIHHRGQGYTYLRALGIEPPPFWERE